MSRARTANVAFRLLLPALAALAAACDRPSVTVYVSADEDVSRPVFEEFERRTGIRVDAKFDTEATKTTGLANTVRAERERPRADVFWSNEQAAPVGLAQDGLLVPDDAARSWPAPWRDPDARWWSFAGRARVIVYAPDRVKEPPRAWAELADPRWKGRIAMADPRFGTTRSHFGAMKAWWNTHAVPGYFEAFAAGLAANEPRVLTSGNAGVIDAGARGGADGGTTDTDDVQAALARGLKLAMVVPRHAHDAGVAGGGTYLIPNTLGLVAGSPHPREAAAFLAYMRSPDVERRLAGAPWRHVPLVVAPAEGDLAVPDPLAIDPAAVVRAADGAVQAFLDARAKAGAKAE
jgi:iron(III) transport system substrate-binding protein